MKTQWGETIDAGCVLPEYPRPQMQRDNYRILNGWWSYAFTGQDSEKPDQWDGQILVPFSPESVLSGVKRQLMPDQSLWYEREILLTEEERQTLEELLDRMLHNLTENKEEEEC